MTDLIEVKTADLVGEQLAWAVGKAEGLDAFLAPPEYGNPWRVFVRHQADATEHFRRYNPHEDWELGGPLIEVHRIELREDETGWAADRSTLPNGLPCNYDWCGYGTTPLIAVCRARSSGALGDTVQVPKELMPCPT